MMVNRLFCFILALLPIHLFGLENRFNYITSENGLTQGNINCIMQDRQGFIWIGTGTGLNKYDGYEFVRYTSNPDDSTSLVHSEVIEMCQATDGKIWTVSNGNGISVYLPEFDDFKQIPYIVSGKDTVHLGQMTEAKVGPDGNIWTLGLNNGLFIFDNNFHLVHHYSYDPKNKKSLPQGQYDALAFDKKGTCWIGLGKGQICSFDPKDQSFHTLTFSTGESSYNDQVKVMYTDRKGLIWIGTLYSGAFRFNPYTGVFKNYSADGTKSGLDINMVRTFVEDKDGNMIIGTDGGGLNVLSARTGQMQYISYNVQNPSTLNTNAVYCLFIDRSQTLWVGTYSGGINYQSKYQYKFKGYKPNPLSDNSLSFANVTAIIEDHDNHHIWIGMDGGGLNEFNPATGNFKRFKTEPDNPDWIQTKVIIHMCQIRNGDILYGTWAHGLGVYKKSEGKFVTYMPDEKDTNSIGSINAWYIMQDSHGEIWVGLLLGRSALDKFDEATGTFKHYYPNPKDSTALYLNSTKVIYEDHSGTVWVGCENGGLFRYNRDKDNFKRYFFDPANPNSTSNDIRGIYEDTKNRFWVATSNGLILLDRKTGSFKRISVADGLPDKVIDGILQDAKGNLWISTNTGISRFNPDSNTFRNYDKTDGLTGNEFNYTSSLLASDGKMYFGSKSGMVVFDPLKISDNPNMPQIVLTDFQIFNKSVDLMPVKEHGHKIKKNVLTLNKIKLSYKQNVITFKFAALDFGNPSKNEYKYKLEGFDQDWIPTTANRRYATYTNLPGGTYTFRVIGSNGDGKWNTKGLSISLIITPPFWRTWWFWTITILIVLYLSWRYYKGRQEKIRQDKQILEEKIQEGLKEVEKQKLEVQKKDKELEEKIAQEKEQNWFNVGMARFGDVISKNKDELTKLSGSIISEIVEYLGVVQGAIYLYSDDDEEGYLELTACYAPDEDRIEGQKFLPGEGQIGTAFSEQRVITNDNLTHEYAKLTSGLGEEYLKHLAVIPLKLNEIVIGVVELLSFNPIENYKVQFIEKAGESLTSILTALRANAKTQKLLEQQKLQSEEMSSQEEELRQNLEEMQATQEEAARKTEELMVQTAEFEVREKELKDEIDKLKSKIKSSGKKK